MNLLIRFIPNRVIPFSFQLVRVPRSYKLVSQIHEINIHFKRSMSSQKSITSFFKATPKKVAAIKEEQADALEKDVQDEDTSPISSGKGKRSSKRLRSNSSSSSKSVDISPPSSSDKKKKAKRQRIESSGSEAESPVPEPLSPPSPHIKVEKSTTTPKTYASPKSKKVKGKKVLVEENSVKNKSPTKSTIKEEKSPFSKKVVKKEVVSPADKKVKTENNVKENGQGDKKVSSEEETKVPELEYNPSKPKYHPIKDACWLRGQPVPYIALAKTLDAIEGTSARLKMVDTLANYFRSVIVLTPGDLLPSVYMCLNQLAPAYHSLELGIAETYLMKAVGQCTGQTLAQVKAAAARAGGLAAAAAAARAQQRTVLPPPKLYLHKVFAALKEVAHMTGHASVNKKIAKIQSLFTSCRNCEAKFLIRSLEGKLRIGLAEQSVLQALAVATATTPPDPDGVKVMDASQGLPADEFKARVDAHALTIKTTYCECPNYDLMVPVLLAHGVAALPDHCKLTPGIPLKPMLAHPTKGVHEVLNRFENCEFTCEWKYDGERAQIHVPAAGDKADFQNAAVFSRNQENNTSKYPDIIRRLPALLKDSVTSCVLDCEAVAYDTENKQILPFQVLSTRKRKDATEASIRVQVCVFVFDLLYLNGEPLVRSPLQRRRELLRDHCHEVTGEWQFATSSDCTSTEAVQQCLEDAIKGSCEGLMVKALVGDQAQYDIARRSHNWLKLKKDYLDGVGDTIDAVVIGAYHGRGKRAGVYGGFLLAVPDQDQFQSLCKIGTGFSEEQLTSLTAILKEHVIPEPKSYYRFDPQHAADVWVSARCVWEVKCADLSLSPAHHAALGLLQPGKGVSLRFPRFVRERPDKTPEQATSARQVADLYLSQDQVKNSTTNKAVSHDDFY